MQPLGEEHSVMRTEGLSSMLETIKTNINAGNTSADFFEIATIYIKTDKELPDEKQKLVIGSYGSMDFFGLKSAVSTLLDNLDIKPYMFRTAEEGAFHPYQSASLIIRGQNAGTIGKIHPKIAKNYDIKQAIFAAELDFNMLFECRGRGKKYKEISKFPKITRDLAFLLDKKVPVGDVLQDIRSIKSPIFESAEFFDIYEG
ncbi:phenylalanine--tRNA ligase subunit beta-related protein, partial [Treponema sp. R6D11]